MKVMKTNSSQNLMVLYKMAIYQLRNQYVTACAKKSDKPHVVCQIVLNIHALTLSKSEVKEPTEFD